MATSSNFGGSAYPGSISSASQLVEAHGASLADQLLITVAAGDLTPEQASLAPIASRLEPGLVPVELAAVKHREQLRKSEERFVKAFRSNPLAISITTQSEGRYVDVNDAFLEMLGYERDQVIGHTAEELSLWLMPDDVIRVTRELAENGTVKRRPISFRTKAGEIREANVSAELIELDGLPCVLAITQDITETKRLEDQLRQAQKLEAIGRLAGGMAHDFNNMLSVIMGYSDLSLQNLSSADPVAKNVLHIKNAAERAASFIRRLLAFSSQQVQYPRILDLNLVIRNLSHMMTRMIGEDIVLSLRPVASPTYVEADLGHLEQILMNLVVNARDAMPSGGELIIETSHDDLDNSYVDAHSSAAAKHYAVLSVSDSGCGMDENVLARIFEPFFTTKPPGQGTGLGLSTVFGIVKQSNGKIFVRSKPGVGTTFKIFLPRIEETSDTCPKTREEVRTMGASETILLAEDDDAVRLLVVTMLESAGYRVLPARDAKQALQLFEERGDDVALLLSDCVMPGMSGRELASQLRSRRADLRILLMSGYAPDLVLRQAALEWGQILTKPFTRNSLLEMVRAALSVNGAERLSPLAHP